MPSESYALDAVSGEAEALDSLIRRAQGGDEEAFEEILRRFEHRALAIARHLGASPEDAEEIAQEAFIKLFRHIGSYRGGRRFTSYFYRIVVNAARDYRARRGAGNEATDARETAEGAPERAAGGGESLARREEVRQAMARLSDREREVVVLRELQGLSTWEVARALRLNPVTVRRHWMRARQRLKEILGL